MHICVYVCVCAFVIDYTVFSGKRIMQNKYLNSDINISESDVLVMFCGNLLRTFYLAFLSNSCFDMMLSMMMVWYIVKWMVRDLVILIEFEIR